MSTLKSKFGILKKIPKEFEAFGYKVPIFLDHDMIEKEEALMSNQIKLEGFYDPEAHIIVIDPNIKDSKRKLEVFIHELLECGDDLLNLNMDHSKLQSLGALLAQMILTGK